MVSPGIKSIVQKGHKENQIKSMETTISYNQFLGLMSAILQPSNKNLINNRNSVLCLNGFI